MNASQVLSRIVIVLNEARDPVNIGGVVRAMKNMGLGRLRLVRSTGFDAYRIEGVAHTGVDIVESAESFDSIPAAVADCRLVIGTTARGRRARRNYVRPREAAAESMRIAVGGGDVALVFGREDRGLSNEELDHCSRVLVIPTDPDHPSINLAQAVLIVAYEIFLASGAEPSFKEPRRTAVPADSRQMEGLYREIEETLHAVEFFKTHSVRPIMRTVRRALGRAALDRREANVFRAMAIEVRKFLARRIANGE